MPLGAAQRTPPGPRGHAGLGPPPEPPPAVMAMPPRSPGRRWNGTHPKSKRQQHPTLTARGLFLYHKLRISYHV